MAVCKPFCIAVRCAGVVGLLSSVAIMFCTVAKISRVAEGPISNASPAAGFPSIFICTPSERSEPRTNRRIIFGDSRQDERQGYAPDVEDLLTEKTATLVVDGQAAVGVTVEGEARVRAVVGKNRDADTCRNHQVLAFQVERTQQQFLDALCNPHRILGFVQAQHAGAPEPRLDAGDRGGADLEPQDVVERDEVDRVVPGGGPHDVASGHVRPFEVAVVRDGEEWYAIYDECSHAAIPLSEGDVEGNEIECWLHGSRFDLRTGKPVNLPATEPVQTFPTTIEGDTVLVDLSSSTNSQELNA